MSQDQLGLIDTPPDRRQIRLSIAIVCLLCATLPLIWPVRAIPLPAITAFIPTVDAIMFLGEAITATLLYAQASVFRSRALVALATGYALTALLVAAHALTFPGAFAPDGLFGAGLSTAAWLAYGRRWVFPVAVLLYIWLKREESAALPGTERPAVRIAVWILAAVAAAAGATLLTTAGQDFLPSYFVTRSEVIYSHALWYQTVLLAAFVTAGVMLFRARRSVLDVWLLVAMACWVVETLANMMLTARFTAGWYSFFAVSVFSHLIVMLALIVETNRLHARLALATIGRNRERHARLMSLDAVAAAISHEIGQPLTANRLQAGMGRSRLTAAKPDVGSAIKALDAILEAEHRTSDVLKSIRAMFARRRGGRTEFNLNDLARATVVVMDRDLAAHRVSLELSLDDELPRVLADPVQIQRVLVNLLTNAIESLDAIEGRPRRITIRSTALEGQAVLLEVSDNGAGIAPDALDQIFEVYFTTKATGIGLGLSLCRIVIEACGGCLWASRGERYGATFHLQLPRSAVFGQ